MNRSRIVTAGAAAAVLVAGGVVGVIADGPAPEARGEGPSSAEPRLVLVSGRDDHGMVALHQVPLYDQPDGDRTVAEVHDGTLAEVVAVEGSWLQVRTVEGPAAFGWVDDYHLRGEARLVGEPPLCRTSIAGQAREGGAVVVVRELRGGQVRVESVTPPLVHGWASRSDLQELPPQGPRCGDVPAGDVAHTH